MLAPHWALLPLVILATIATVIASQAVITGAFSLTRQAIQLGLLPRMEIQHKSETQEGQIFIPKVNRILLIGVLLLVLMFRSSSALASAYGIAVTGTMVVTTALAFVVVWRKWHWPLWRALAFVSFFLLVDFAFFAANLVKIVDGGWVPLMIGCFTMIVMWTFVRGNALLAEKMQRDSIPLRELIPMLEKSKPTRVPGTAIFLTNQLTSAPSALLHNIKHNKVLHEHVWLMSVRTEDTPRVPAAKRYEIEKLSPDFTTVTLHFGYMESPRIPAALALLRKSGHKFDIMTTSFFLGRRTIKASHQLRHAGLAGQSLHRSVQTGDRRDGILLHPLGPRRRTRRTGGDLKRSRLHQRCKALHSAPARFPIAWNWRSIRNRAKSKCWSVFSSEKSCTFPERALATVHRPEGFAKLGPCKTVPSPLIPSPARSRR